MVFSRGKQIILYFITLKPNYPCSAPYCMDTQTLNNTMDKLFYFLPIYSFRSPYVYGMRVSLIILTPLKLQIQDSRGMVNNIIRNFTTGRYIVTSWWVNTPLTIRVTPLMLNSSGFVTFRSLLIVLPCRISFIVDVPFLSTKL